MELVVPYEVRMRQDRRWAGEEIDSFFMRNSKVFATLTDLTHRLDEAGIPYALVGALALGQHGLDRVTVGVDMLITKEGLEAFRARYEGLGYVPAFPGASKQFRATETGVRVDFITTGEYPGDGKPKSVAFPDPAQFWVEINGIRVIVLEKFIELKLTSGLTASHCLKDLSDIQELIRAANLPLELDERLDESVRPKYRQLWDEMHTPEALGDRH